MADALVRILPSIPPFLTSWVPGQTPMSTWSATSTAILTYLTVIFGLRELMKDRTAFDLKTVFRIHNAFLSLASLVVLILEMEEVVKLWFNVGPYDTLCAGASWTRRLELYYIVNYYLKYIEFFDTVFLVLKKRPLSFLHVFHHSSTALLGFVGFKARISGSWIYSSINSGIHVVMYYYYFAAAGGAKLWWKKHLTMMQMLQFIFFVVVTSFGLYQHLAFRYWPYLPHIGDCAGDPKIAISAIVLVTSFLILFFKFYLHTYTKGIEAANDKGGNGESQH